MNDDMLPVESLQGDRPDLRAEAPAADGIRWGLVEHVRALIDSGCYDTPERWAQAEARILHQIEEG
jgi:hypothetical protein